MAYEPTPYLIGKGGTNTTVFTPYAVVLGPKADNTSLQDVGAVGIAGQVLTSNGAGTIPTWQAGSSSTFKNGTAAKNSADASTTQNIAHGLGAAPKSVRITALPDGTAYDVQSHTTYNGTTQSSISIYGTGATKAYLQSFALNSTADQSGNKTEGSVTFDATNIIITWTKTGSPTGTYMLLWEAIG